MSVTKMVVPDTDYTDGSSNGGGDNSNPSGGNAGYCSREVGFHANVCRQIIYHFSLIASECISFLPIFASGT